MSDQSATVDANVLAAMRLCHLFASCSPKTQSLAVTRGQVQTLAPGECIFREGDPSCWFYILVSGKVKATHFGQAMSSTSTPGYVGGLTSAVYAAEHSGITVDPSADKRSFTHEAVTAVSILKIDVNLFHELSVADSEFHLGIMRYFAERLRAKSSRLASMMHESKTGGNDNVFSISVYDTKPYDRANLSQAFASAVCKDGKQLKLHCLESKLDESTCSLAMGSDAVCIFVNDQCTANILRKLKLLGISLVLLRCAGFNNVDLEEAARLGISVARVPSYSPHAVAEHALALLMAVTRNTHLAYNRVRNGNYTLAGLEGRDLHGLTVGVVGTGQIGQIFARIAAAGLGMKVKLWDAYPNQMFAKSIGAEYVSDFLALCEMSDVISFHVPLTKETTHLFDERASQRCKPGCVVLNTSRGPVVDAQALLTGIVSGRIGAAGLDVYEKEKDFFFESSDTLATMRKDDVLARLINLPNVVVTSHQAFLTSNALTAIAETTRKNALEFFSDGKRGVALTNSCMPPPPPKPKSKL